MDTLVKCSCLHDYSFIHSFIHSFIYSFILVTRTLRARRLRAFHAFKLARKNDNLIVHIMFNSKNANTDIAVELCIIPSSVSIGEPSLMDVAFSASLSGIRKIKHS